MREIDSYAQTVGVEVIPCIQTLAHLNAISRWQQYVMDTPDILMVDDESTYDLIDKMFKTLSECFATRRLHVGMDEAHMLGRGKHLEKYGYETVDVIMKRHLARVCEIAKKYGYDIMIWSDMYFRPWNEGEYFIGKKQVPEEYIKALPDNVIPVYWDYYSDDFNNYDAMFHNHRQLSSAGSSWKKHSSGGMFSCGSGIRIQLARSAAAFPSRGMILCSGSTKRMAGETKG